MKLLRPRPNNFRRLNFALPLLLIFCVQKICAQLAPPDDFFNRGAQLYISNNIPAAKEQVETGLKFYPDDEKLKKLEELLKQQQQQQQQQQNQQSQSQQNQSQNQNSSQQQKNQQNQNQQNQSQQNQQQSQQQKNSQEQQAKNQEQKNEEQKQQEQKAAAEKATGQTNENQNAGQEVAAQMTPEEAKRLLDSQKGDEQFLQLKPQGKPEDAQRKIKDW